MSVSLWTYVSEICDGGYCSGDCDICKKSDEAMEYTEIMEAVEGEE